MKIPFLFGCLLVSTLMVDAQDSTIEKNKWSFFVEPYLMFPTMSGTIGLGNLPETSVKANPGDILSHLQIGAMLHVEAHNGKNYFRPPLAIGSWI